MLVAADLLVEGKVHVVVVHGVGCLPFFLVIEVLGLLWRQVLSTRHLCRIQIASLAFVTNVVVYSCRLSIINFYQPIFQNVLSRLRLALGRIRLLNLHRRILLLRYLRAILTANS